MGFFLNLDFNHTYCPRGCKIFNDESNFSYWEDKLETTEEKNILSYMHFNQLNLNKKILHIGIGNSFLAKNLYLNNHIDGITISKNEILKAKKLNINNYNFFFQNKYSKNNILDKMNLYDIIIDANLKSYCCCETSFENLMKRYFNILNKKGKIITSLNGMGWSRLVKPVLSFSFKKFFYKRLKEFDGPKSNILTIKDCNQLAKKFKYKLKLAENNILIFNKH